MEPKYKQYISKYTSNKRLGWKEACEDQNLNENKEVLLNYKQILNLEQSESDEICKQLDNYEEELKKLKINNADKCINPNDLNGDDINNINPENFHILKENNVIYCEDIVTLMKLLKTYNKKKKDIINPYTGNVLDNNEIDNIKKKYEIYSMISTGQHYDGEEIVALSETILLNDLSILYNIMTHLSSKTIFMNAKVDVLEIFIQELRELNIKDEKIFTDDELNKIKNNDINKYKSQLIQLVLAKSLRDKFKYSVPIVNSSGDNDELMIYPIREKIQVIWNKIFIG